MTDAHPEMNHFRIYFAVSAWFMLEIQISEQNETLGSWVVETVLVESLILQPLRLRPAAFDIGGQQAGTRIQHPKHF